MNKNPRRSRGGVCQSQSLQVVALNLSVAYQNFFEKKAGFPSFKSKHGRQSVSYPQNVKVGEKSIKLPIIGEVSITQSPFYVIRRPPYSRRQLHLMVPAKGGIRRKYGGSTTRHNVRKGDLVSSPKGIGYVSGDTEKQVSVSEASWKRLGRITANKVQLIHRSNGLVVT